MSATGETTNYGLPLYNGTDYANFFDMNTTNNKLDEVLKSIQTKAETADTKADANTTAIDQANDSINDNMTAIDGIQANLTTFQQNLNTQGTRIDNVETSVTGVNATLQTVAGEVATNTEDIATLMQAGVHGITQNIISNIQSVNHTDKEIYIGSNSLMQHTYYFPLSPTLPTPANVISAVNPVCSGLSNINCSAPVPVAVSNTLQINYLCDSSIAMPSSLTLTTCTIYRYT